MKQFILLLLGLMLLQPATQVFAKDELPFHFSGVTTKQLTAAQLKAAEKTRTKGVVNNAKGTLTFKEKDIQLVVRTGPEDDMLSYRIQGLRNPIVVVPENATVKVLFVNVDDDMPHDFRLGNVQPPFTARPDISKTAGSDHLAVKTNGIINAQSFSFHVHNKATLRYFCSVGSHAKNGMWGTLVVGDSPIPTPSTQHPAGHHHDRKNGMTGMPGM